MAYAHPNLFDAVTGAFPTRNPRGPHAASISRLVGTNENLIVCTTIWRGVVSKRVRERTIADASD